MARSIGDWYADHASSSLGDAFDDEVVETQNAWDLHSHVVPDPRVSRQGSGHGAGRQRSANRQSVGGASTRGRNQSRANAARAGNDTSLESKIRSAAKAHTNLGHKMLAALLRARGVPVTKAQVAEVLSRPQSSGRQQSRGTLGARKPAMVVRVSAAAQSSRTIHSTPLCDSCGMRLSVVGTCRCS